LDSYWSGGGRFFEGVFRIAKYPTDIFGKPFKIILSYVLPISFIATFPAKSLLGILSWQNIIFSLFFTATLLFFSLKFWNFALRRYSSASS
jgi:ABC-2 type transport system permease protein